MISQTTLRTQEYRPFAAFAGLDGACAAPGRPGPAAVAVAGGLHENVNAGETLFAEGEESENVYQVIQGVFRLHKLLSDGRRQITGFAQPGHLMGLAQTGGYIHSAEAITQAYVRRYPRARFERMVEEVPGLAHRLLTMTFNELHAAQDRMLLLGRKHAVEKVASFLLEMAAHQGAADEVHIPMGRGDIADYLGLTKETVCKLLSQLKRDGVIAASSVSRIRLRDRDRLEDLAAGDLADALQAA